MKYTWLGTFQHQTKDFCFVTLKFAVLPDPHILIDNGKMLVISKIKEL